jgi:hypothetical protein
MARCARRLSRVVDARAPVFATAPKRWPRRRSVLLRGLCNQGVSDQQRGAAPHFEESLMGLGTVLLIVLILLLIGVIPAWPHSRGWGYAPSGALGLVVVVVLVLLVLGRL